MRKKKILGGGKKSKNVKIIKSPFLDLSESLQFIVFNLNAGDSSKGSDTMEGFVVYTLTMTEPITAPNIDQGPDKISRKINF